MTAVLFDGCNFLNVLFFFRVLIYLSEVEVNFLGFLEGIRNMPRSIDDPLFALILRFAGFNQKVSLHNAEFFKKQLEEIKKHVDHYQPEEKSAHAIEWIEQYASRYRDAWNKEIITREVSAHRCPDCPLRGDDSHGQCEIHDRWIELLQQYVTGDIDSKEYIEDALDLLSEHKEDLTVKFSALPLSSESV
jgi:hypothetical protein